MEQNSDRPTSKYDPGMLAKVLSIVGWNVVGPLHKLNSIQLNANFPQGLQNAVSSRLTHLLAPDNTPC